MITILSGKMTIPENDRFVGFAGDNLVITKQFFIKDIVDENYIYRLYLSFDDNTYNYLQLDKTVGEDGTTLTWNVKSDDIFKSGVVMAQIKIFSTSDEIFHTTTDYFIVAPSAEFTDAFGDKENSEFLEYETRLNSLLEEINSAKQYLPYVDQDGYWHIFDSEDGEYKQSDYSVRLEDYFTVDSQLSSTSTNPVENKAVYEALAETPTIYKGNGLPGSVGNAVKIGDVYIDISSVPNGIYRCTYDTHGISKMWMPIAKGSEINALNNRVTNLQGAIEDLTEIKADWDEVYTWDEVDSLFVKKSDVDSSVNANSNNPVSGQAVYNYIQSLNGNGVNY